jgi:hypothetical protein
MNPDRDFEESGVTGPGELQESCHWQATALKKIGG